MKIFSSLEIFNLQCIERIICNLQQLKLNNYHLNKLQNKHFIIYTILFILFCNKIIFEKTWFLIKILNFLA